MWTGNHHLFYRYSYASCHTPTHKNIENWLQPRQNLLHESIWHFYHRNLPMTINVNMKTTRFMINIDRLLVFKYKKKTRQNITLTYKLSQDYIFKYMTYDTLYNPLQDRHQSITLILKWNICIERTNQSYLVTNKWLWLSEKWQDLWKSNPAIF